MAQKMLSKPWKLRQRQLQRGSSEAPAQQIWHPKLCSPCRSGTWVQRVSEHSTLWLSNTQEPLLPMPEEDRPWLNLLFGHSNAGDLILGPAAGSSADVAAHTEKTGRKNQCQRSYISPPCPCPDRQQKTPRVLPLHTPGRLQHSLPSGCRLDFFPAFPLSSPCAAEGVLVPICRALML